MRLTSLVGVLTVVATVAVVYCSSSSRVSLVKNGYDGIVVAISPALNESLANDIISSIKTVMTEASAVLFRATRNRTYFKDIKVLLPVTWANTSYDESALDENFEESDIRVEARSLYGDQPYTVRAGGCGQPGQHVVLTPEYLTDDQLAAWWGPRGKALVHEWAKLRWGVFEEFGYPNDTLFPLLYWTSGEGEKPVVMPNYCTNEKPKGSLRDRESDGPCHYHNGLPDNNCRFVPDSGQKMASSSSSSSSSLMAFYYLSGTERFCDSAQEAGHQHNQFAPTRHNELCGGRSVWDVIRRHPDFAKGTNPSTKTWSPPTFRVLRQEMTKFILVLDHSSSMAQFDRMRKVNQTTRWWILHKVASGSFVGIVTLGNETRMVKNLTQLTDMGVRKSVASMTFGHLSGSINITEGILLTLTQLVRSENNVVMVMIAAGESVVNTSTSSTLRSRLVKSGVRLVMVLLGNCTYPELERVARDTGGKSYVVPDEGEDGLLDDAL
ncbi:calcium-activated chloride channel regulator 1-like [Panulirus ornatus]|uniref:calcium-activated chloride channel regulator 1-like n=1 Tax=Panulirus ornatus TaxID=150431 RepID=UPI003A89AF5E